MLQNGYSVIREACMNGHLQLVKILVEVYKCSLNYLWCNPRNSQIVNRQVDEYQSERLNMNYIKEYLDKVFGTNCGNDSLKNYLLGVTKARWKELDAQRKELKGPQVPLDSVDRKCTGSELLQVDCPSTWLRSP